MTGRELHDRLVRSGKRVPAILITAFPRKTVEVEPCTPARLLPPLTIDVIDVAEGEDIPARAAQGSCGPIFSSSTRSIWPLVGADLWVMEADASRMRDTRPFVRTNPKSATGVDSVAEFIIEREDFRRRPEGSRMPLHQNIVPPREGIP